MGRTVEVDEDEWNRRSQLTNIASRIYANPKARLLLEQAQKVVDPNAPTPAIDDFTAAQQPFNALKDEIAALKKQVADREAETKIAESAAATKRMQDEGFAALRQQHYTTEGLAAVEKLMTEKGILDPRDAAILFERNNPPQQVATPGGSGGWNFLEGVQDNEADLKRLIDTKGESEPLLNKMINESLADARGQAVRR